MDGSVLRLYPLPAVTRPLAGLYLAERLYTLGTRERPFVYSNFVSSLDGRIAQADPKTGRRRVPPAVANPRDWRLYLELLAQADALITSATHVRAVVEGRQRNLLPIGDPPPDLLGWRQAQGMPAHPALAVVSERLQIPPAAVQVYPGPLLVITGDAAPRAQVAGLEKHGIEVVRAGPGPRVHGRDIVRALAARGYLRIYSIAGAQMLYTLLEADVLERLYLTVAHVVLCGESYDGLCRGPVLNPARSLRLQSLFLDTDTPDPAGQLFASFGRAGARG